MDPFKELLKDPFNGTPMDPVLWSCLLCGVAWLPASQMALGGCGASVRRLWPRSLRAEPARPLTDSGDGRLPARSGALSCMMRQAVLEAPLHKLGWDRMIGSALSLSLSRPLVVPQPCLPASQSPAAAVARGAARRAMEQPGQPALAGKRARTAAASAPFFPSISKIRYEGPESLNPLAFKYYQPDELVMGNLVIVFDICRS